MLHTAFTDLIGCEVPIQLAPMGTICTPELMAAVNDAGGMAMTGLPMAPAAVVAEMLDGIGEQVEGSFGFNVLIPFVDVEVVDAAAARCRLVDFYHGAVDASLVERVHAAGALAGWQVGSVDEARAAADAGCDLLVVRGTEGGGRMYGARSLWPFLTAVLDAVDVPVVAAGGVADGRGLAAALAAGASAVRMGTRFVAAAESGAHPVYKDAIARETDTVLTDEFRVEWPDPIVSSRVLRSAVEHAAELADGAVAARVAMGPMTIDVPKFGVVPPTTAAEGDIAAMALYAGESAALIDTVEPAGEIIARVVRQAEDRLRSAMPA
jgi:NAD(P)H-dependent flavin oxidoreductase YrpB (nitropropane dioxygenase family)